jgi:galactitol-specific phosphotransferase system IIC component
MNLQNLNLVELNAQEVQETEGGLFGIDDAVWIGAALGVALGIITTQDLDRVGEAFKKGFAAGSK